MPHTPSPAAILAGRIVSALVAIVLALDGLSGLLMPRTLAEPMAKSGFPATMLPVVCIAALASAIVYAVPRTAPLGAILVTGFVGGAIATHVRLEQLAAPEQLLCAAIGVGAWAGLWLRDPRMRSLLPFGG